MNKINTNHEFAIKLFLFSKAGLQNQPNILQLGIRLDFNEYYKNRDQRLDTPLTFKIMQTTINGMQYRNSNVMISSIGTNATVLCPSRSRFLTQSYHN